MVNFFDNFVHTQKEYTFDVVVGLYALAFQTMFNFFLGYFADKFTSASLNVTNIVYAMNWFEFPVKEQKLILIMIQRAQIQFHFKGNDTIVCSTHKFVQVCCLAYFLVEIFFCSSYSIILMKFCSSFFQIIKSAFFYYVFFKMIKYFRVK